MLHTIILVNNSISVKHSFVREFKPEFSLCPLHYSWPALPTQK